MQRSSEDRFSKPVEFETDPTPSISSETPGIYQFKVPKGETPARNHRFRRQIEILKRTSPKYEKGQKVGSGTTIEPGKFTSIQYGNLEDDLKNLKDVKTGDGYAKANKEYLESLSKFVLKCFEKIRTSTFDIDAFDSRYNKIKADAIYDGDDDAKRRPFSEYRFKILTLDELVVMLYSKIHGAIKSKENDKTLAEHIKYLNTVIDLIDFWIITQGASLKRPSEFIRIPLSDMVYVANDVEMTPGLTPNVFLYMDSLLDEIRKMQPKKSKGKVMKEGKKLDRERIKRCLDRLMDCLSTGVHKLLVNYNLLVVPGNRGRNIYYYVHHSDPIESAMLVESLSRRIQRLPNQPVEGFDPLLLSIGKINSENADACTAFVKYDSIYRQIHRLFINSDRFKSAQLSELNRITFSTKDNTYKPTRVNDNKDLFEVTAKSNFMENVNFILLIQKIKDLIDSLKKDRQVSWGAFVKAFAANLGTSSRSGLIGNISKEIKKLEKKIEEEKSQTTPNNEKLKELQESLDQKKKDLSSVRASPSTGKAMATPEELRLFAAAYLGDQEAQEAYMNLAEKNKDNPKFRNMNLESNYKITDGNGIVLHEVLINLILSMDAKVKLSSERERHEWYKTLIETFVTSTLFRTYVLEFIYYAIAIYTYARFTAEASRERKRSEDELKKNEQALKVATSSSNTDEIEKYTKLIKVYKDDIKKQKKELKSLAIETKESRHAKLIDLILKEANEGRPLDYVLDESDASTTGVGKKRKEIEQRIGCKITDQQISVVKTLCKTGVLKVSDGYTTMGQIVGMHPEAVQYIIQYHK